MSRKFTEFNGTDILERENKPIDWSWKSTFKRQKHLNELNIKCKNCGHTIFPSKDRMLCTHCGRWVYKNDKIEFQYRLKETSKKY